MFVQVEVDHENATVLMDLAIKTCQLAPDDDLATKMRYVRENIQRFLPLAIRLAQEDVFEEFGWLEQ